MIDLTSDTVTRPTPAMLDAMIRAQVGDDVMEEDPTINVLQEKAADMFGMGWVSISICLSKGLGCPVGSLLLGDRDFIREAKRVRKVMAGVASPKESMMMRSLKS